MSIAMDYKKTKRQLCISRDHCSHLISVDVLFLSFRPHLWRGNNDFFKDKKNLCQIFWRCYFIFPIIWKHKIQLVSGIALFKTSPLTIINEV